MEKVVGYLAYPIFELSMFADQIGNGIGVTVTALAITLACIFTVSDGATLSKQKIYSAALFLAPFFIWFIWLLLPVSNAGAGNFVLELWTLISLAISLSLTYRISKCINAIRSFSKYFNPYLWLSFSVIVMRLFMPFVGK